MAIVIKKRVSLAFLGDEFKDSYLEFKSIPLKDYTDISEKQGKIDNDTTKAIPFMLDILNKYFLNGKVQDVEVTKEDLGDLDQTTAIKCFESLTGVLDPKAEGPSTTQSSTELPPPSN